MQAVWLHFLNLLGFGVAPPAIVPKKERKPAGLCRLAGLSVTASRGTACSIIGALASRTASGAGSAGEGKKTSATYQSSEKVSPRVLIFF
jgi:hypothetical protein